MKRTGLIFGLSIILVSVSGQSTLLSGFMAGGSLYNGDIAKFYQSGVGPAGGMYGEFVFPFQLAFRLNIAYGSVNSKDKINPERKLAFRTSIFEYSFMTEFFFTEAIDPNVYQKYKSGKRNFKFSTYVFFGIGRIHFNPQGKYLDGVWYDLQPLTTEGQGKFVTREPYDLNTTVFPFGFGIRYPVSPLLKLGLEVGFRRTFTDYLDDVSLTYVNTDYLASTMDNEKGKRAAYFADPSMNKELTTTSPATARGNPKYQDSYMFISLTLTYEIRKIGKKKSFRI